MTAPLALPAEAAALDVRIVEVPRPPADPAAPGDPAPAARWRMLPAVAMAHAGGRPLVSAWLRARPNGPAAVLVGGLGAVPPGGGPLAFPAGARGVPLTAAQRQDALGKFGCWVRAQVSLDATAAGDGSPTAPALEDLLALLPDRPMGVLVVARPIGRPKVQPRLDELSDAIDRLEAMRSGRGFERLRLARAEAELSYLERSAPQGLWELEVWTAAATEADARGVAALVGGSADLADVALSVRPDAASGGADGVAWSGAQVVGGDCVAALARPPQRELPGIRVVDVPSFDLTPEVAGDLLLGQVLDASRAPSVPCTVPADSVNRHVFVTGATGSGKSQTVRALLTQLSGASVPWMVIEPAKSEYARMAGRIREHGKVVVIRPGAPDAVPGSINPLEPSSIAVAGGRAVFPLQTHLDLVRALFTASFQAEEPFPQILAVALAQSYEALGWNLALGRPVDGDVAPRYPTLSDVQRQALLAVDAIGYGREVRDNVQGFVRVRIDSLRQGTPGRFFEGGHPLDVESLLTSNVVFEIEDLGDDRDKAFFIGTILIRIFEVLRLRAAHGLQADGLNHVTVVEEAHRLLHRTDETSPSAQAVTMFANLLAEVRAYGEGIVVAEQIPAKIIPDVVKNSAVKVVHRLPAADDRAFVGATMNLTEEQSSVVVSLPPGTAAVHVDGMDAPVLVAVDGSGAAREGRAKVPAAAPVGPRSPACPSVCRADPCTLEQLEVSRCLPDAGSLALWAEVVTLAHLMGEPPRSVGAALARSLRAADPARVRCALGLAADAAVDRRSGAIRRFYDPAALKRQVVTVMRRQLDDGYDAPVQDARWLVASYRWADVLRALRRTDGADVHRPHPDTGSWAARGLRLDGGTWDEQRAEARAASERHAALFDAAFLGQPSVIAEQCRSGTGAPSARFEALLAEAGLPVSWPVFRLGAHLDRGEQDLA